MPLPGSPFDLSISRQTGNRCLQPLGPGSVRAAHDRGGQADAVRFPTGARRPPRVPKVLSGGPTTEGRLPSGPQAPLLRKDFTKRTGNVSSLVGTRRTTGGWENHLNKAPEEGPPVPFSGYKNTPSSPLIFHPLIATIFPFSLSFLFFGGGGPFFSNFPQATFTYDFFGEK